MNRNFFYCIAGLVIALLLSLPALAAEVSQGRCIQFDQERHQITIEEYDTQFSAESPYGRPTGVQATFQVGGAMMGIPPEAGDILRMAYTVNGSERVALKVMNVSKQDLRKK
jgi:hypothetical protein